MAKKKNQVQKNVDKAVLTYVFCNEGILSREVVREELCSIYDIHYINLTYTALLHLKIIVSNELNPNFQRIYNLDGNTRYFIIEAVYPLLSKYIVQRDVLQDDMRWDFRYSCENDAQKFSDQDLTLLINDFKNKRIQENENNKFSYDTLQIGFERLDILESAIKDLLDRLINNDDSTPNEHYCIDTQYDNIYKILLQDVVFKKILYDILKTNATQYKYTEINAIINTVNKSLIHRVKGTSDIRKYIIDAFFVLGIFVGDRQNRKQDAIFRIDLTLNEHYDTKWKMNALTKVESIKYIVGELTRIRPEKISEEQKDAVLRIFNYS